MEPEGSSPHSQAPATQKDYVNKNTSDAIGNQHRDLPVWVAVFLFIEVVFS
jgi:hypothetical protein